MSQDAPSFPLALADPSPMAAKRTRRTSQIVPKLTLSVLFTRSPPRCKRCWFDLREARGAILVYRDVPNGFVPEGAPDLFQNTDLSRYDAVSWDLRAIMTRREFLCALIDFRKRQIDRAKYGFQLLAGRG